MSKVNAERRKLRISVEVEIVNEPYQANGCLHLTLTNCPVSVDDIEVGNATVAATGSALYTKYRLTPGSKSPECFELEFSAFDLWKAGLDALKTGGLLPDEWPVVNKREEEGS